jgi:cilia- and flagella-associated protein 300
LDYKLFNNINSKDTQQVLTKWGLDKDMELSKFRFNQSFNMFNADRFLKELFNSYEFRAAMPGFSSNLPAKVDSVQYDRLTTEVINMGFFDILPEKEITTYTGYIKKEPEELLDGLQLGDRLRYALAFEESEYYEIFDEQMRKELIFCVFKHISLGGSLCQYED